MSLETCEAGGLTLPSKKIERLDDGRVVVMTPTPPNPWSGKVQIMAHEQVKRLDLPMTAYMENIERFGQGTNELLRALDDLPTTEKGEKP